MINTVTLNHPHPYPPRKTPFTTPFWDALAEGRLITTRFGRDGVPTFPPRNFDPASWNRNVEWVELSGRGILYSVTSVHAAPQVFREFAPYQVAIVDLDDGPRLATAFLGSVETPLDTPVEIVALRYTDEVAFAARPLAG
ncbi:Zn-ribbon domain-containing OB-fold protein [Arthrobacter caoxuetaonis]|uniref:Zn-ribbon domain-containing OB-fold protein n=1 Tax=Arthrobacter caoxuetaonis TaxID=2886935 RepID=UPI001D14A418|nr:OB-fold domain-containing protein [Arthrobacter caoxuetaonis]MCC3281980.1 OB-fold domain-containing protein [Arthrobacter caoxuetaonis]MCC3282981.1 OB-fold domain-containing protein [Arthrobacter caoxuetaonis]